MPKEVRLSRERGDKEETGGVGWGLAPGCWVVGLWLQVWDGCQTECGPPPPLSFPVGHWKVEQGSLAIPPFLKALRVQGVGVAGDREEAGCPRGREKGRGRPGRQSIGIGDRGT